MEKLTQQEEDVMQVIWNTGQGFVKDFLEEMPEPKPPYTTLASTIKNLEKKGFVSDYFKNSYKELVEFFAKDEKISADELKEIINLIEKRKK